MESTQQGDSIHDRILQTLEPQEAPKPEEEIVEDEQSIQDEHEESEETEVETTEESEESEDEEQEPEDDVQTESLTTSELSKVLGFDDDALDLDDDGNVLVKTKIDGEEGKAKLKDLVVSYQLRGHLDKQNKEVTELRKALQEQTAKATQETQERLTQLESMLQVAWGELEASLETPEMKELREENPAEWTARVRELDERKAKIAQSYQTVLDEKQSELQKVSKLDQEKVSEHLNNENQKLMASIEGWSDLEEAQKGLNEVFSYLKTEGFSDEDLYGVRDQQGNLVKLGITNHKAIVMARKAMLYDRLSESKPAVMKKVKTSPKIVKPGQPKQETQQTKVLNLKKAVKQSGGKGRSVVDYLLATGKV